MTAAAFAATLSLAMQAPVKEPFISLNDNDTALARR